MRSTRTAIAVTHHTAGRGRARARLGAGAAAAAVALAMAGCGAQSAQPGAAPATSHQPTSHPTTSHPTHAAGRPTPARTTSTTATGTATTPAATPASSTPVASVPASGATPTTTTTTTSATPSPTITAKKVHFATPEAAMRYLTTAWNDYNMTDLKHVTQGTARTLLLGMYQQAVNLRLDYCALRPGGNGDYLCHFTHDYPASYPVRLRQGKHGSAEFIAAPSASVGWYMFAYEGCG